MCSVLTTDGNSPKCKTRDPSLQTRMCGFVCKSILSSQVSLPDRPSVDFCPLQSNTYWKCGQASFCHLLRVPITDNQPCSSPACVPTVVKTSTRRPSETSLIGVMLRCWSTREWKSCNDRVQQYNCRTTEHYAKEQRAPTLAPFFELRLTLKGLSLSVTEKHRARFL